MSELEFWKDLGNIFDAVLNYQKKNVEFNNRFINPWIRLGNIFDRQDQTNDAVKAYQHATEIDPDAAQNWVDLGDAQFKKGAFNEAIEAYHKAVTLDPQAGWPLGNLALSLVSQGKVEEAIPLYKKSIDLLPDIKDKAICWNRLGNAYRKINDYENAFLAFQNADHFDGDNTGFNDTLDETPRNTSVIAPEEILEQMIVDQDLDEGELELNPSDVANPPTQEILQPDIEAVSRTLTRVETPDRRIALLPNMEMKEESIGDAAQPIIETLVEEPKGENSIAIEETPLSLHEKSFDILQVVEDVIAKVERAFTEQEKSDAGEGQKIEENTLNVEPVQASEEAALEIEYAASELPEFNEDPKPELETLHSSEELQISDKEPRRIPDWLIMKDEVRAGENESVVEIGIQEELVQGGSVTTLSDISQEVAVSEIDVNMDVVETFTDPLAGPLSIETNLIEESIFESANLKESQAELETQDLVTVDELNSADDPASDQEVDPLVTTGQETEQAYEEYLKDVIEPMNILTDHVDDIQGEAPITKVSKNGEVRIVMDTKNAHVWNELGNIYLNAGACDDAIASYSKAIELDRQFAWAYSNLALAYVQKERFAEAVLFYQRGIELFTSDKDKAITWNRLGNVYRRINDYGTAIASYQTADELDPENATLSLRSSFGLLGNMYSDSKPAFTA